MIKAMQRITQFRLQSTAFRWWDCFYFGGYNTKTQHNAHHSISNLINICQTQSNPIISLQQNSPAHNSLITISIQQFINPTILNPTTLHPTILHHTNLPSHNSSIPQYSDPTIFPFHNSSIPQFFRPTTFYPTILSSHNSSSHNSSIAIPKSHNSSTTIFHPKNLKSHDSSIP